MRIWQAFLILVAAALLWLVPVTRAIYDFRTDLAEDTFSVATSNVSSNATVVLAQALYNNDSSTIGVTSNLTADNPAFNSYNSTTRATLFTGLSSITTRTLTVTYDIDALSGDVALDAVMDLTPYIWYLCIVAFPIAGLAAIFTGRA